MVSNGTILVFWSGIPIGGRARSVLNLEESYADANSGAILRTVDRWELPACWTSLAVDGGSISPFQIVV